MPDSLPKAMAAAPATASVPRPALTPLPPVMPFEWACAYGEDEYGLWQAFEVGGVRQVLRWIPPGEFWMGSTPDERKHFGLDRAWDGEGPRHLVRFTQGFWLADSACSQALWQVVVGENPSKFTGDLERPVEQVGWNDISLTFLTRLNKLLPGLDAALPTDAQWEYACRAGTESAYAFGDAITTNQVNFDGNSPPPGARKGEYRERTVPVKSLPANGWGLYEMHGNVWEWCADDRRIYDGSTQVDPVGPQDPESGVRVLRGGSWRDRGWICRSAFRYLNDPDNRSVEFGFRLVRPAC